MPFRDIARDAVLQVPQIKALHAHAMNLQAERDAAVAERDGLRTHLEGVQANLSESQSRERRLAEELRHIQATSEGYHEEIVDLRRGLDDARREIEWRRERERLSQVKEESERWLGEGKEALELRLYVANSDRQRAVAFNDALMSDLRATQDRVADLTARATQHEELGRASAERIEALKAEIALLQQEVREARDRHAAGLEPIEDMDGAAASRRRR